MNFHLDQIKDDFPALMQEISGKQVAYLDSSNTAQKPQSVVNAVADYYSSFSANVHRASYHWGQRATAAYESVRGKVQQLINAEKPEEIVFVRGATEGINLVANSYLETLAKPNDQIILTVLEHHANLVPWQQLAKKLDLNIEYLRIDDAGIIDLDHLQLVLQKPTVMVAMTHISNVLGTVNPVQEAISMIKKHSDAAVLIDGAQSCPHVEVDVQQLQCDFYIGSGHKMYAPPGSGFVYGRYDMLSKMEPYQTGGGMIAEVTLDGSKFLKPPYRFEAGTPDIGAVIGMGAAIDFLLKIGMKNVYQHEVDIMQYLEKSMSELDFVDIYVPNVLRIGSLSFNVKDVHPHDVTQILDQNQVAVKGGHHCAMPLLSYLGLSSVVRASTGIYTDKSDVDRLVGALLDVRKIFNVS